MIPAFALYLLKANALLLLWAGLYAGALRHLTFYHTNRLFLLSGLVLAAGFPLLGELPAWQAAAPLTSSLRKLTYAWSTSSESANTPASYWQAVASLYAAGVAVMLTRLLEQLRALHRLHRSSQPAVWRGQPFRALAAGQAPFAFGRHIYVCPESHAPTELAAVLTHEQAHVAGRHTIDVLLAQVAVALSWFNPGAWLLQRAIRENLEFLADQHALQAGLDRKMYQYSLLRLQQLLPGPIPATHFHSLTLKTRIQMMNQKPTRPAQTLRYLLAVPCCVGLSLLSHARPLQVPAAPAIMQSLLGTQRAEGAAASALPMPGQQAPVARQEARQDGKMSLKTALIFVDGVETSYADMEKNVKPKNIAKMESFTGDDAIAAKYGERGRKGVVLIITKKQ